MKPISRQLESTVKNSFVKLFNETSLPVPQNVFRRPIYVNYSTIIELALKKSRRFRTFKDGELNLKKQAG